MKKFLLIVIVSSAFLGAIYSFVSNHSSELGNFEYENDDFGGVVITKLVGYEDEVLRIPSEIDSCLVTGIGRGVFQDCVSLEKVVIPDSVRSIGDSTFKVGHEIDIHINNIESWLKIDFDSSFNGINQGWNLFVDGVKAEHIVIPNMAMEIKDFAFQNCTSLKEVIIPDFVRRIGESAFEDCSSLESVAVPHSVIEIGRSAFSGCDHDLCVYYDGSKEEWERLNIYSSFDVTFCKI